MIQIHAIREVPPDVDPQTAIQILEYVKRELAKSPDRTLTARAQLTKLQMIYEAKQ